MSKSVSNDALWEKLSEIENKLNKFLMEQEAHVSTQEQRDFTSEIKAAKEKIVEKLEKYIQGLGMHCDNHFKFIRTKIDKQNNDMTDAVACLVYLVKELEKQKKEKDSQSYFSFRFFKVRKASVTVTVLGILVFILTLFCMKQQNDYVFLLDKYHKQGIELREMRIEAESNK